MRRQSQLPLERRYECFEFCVNLAVLLAAAAGSGARTPVSLMCELVNVSGTVTSPHMQ